MVRITNNSLIIEIPTLNEAPLERLANMHIGLLNLIAIIDPSSPKGDGLIIDNKRLAISLEPCAVNSHEPILRLLLGSGP